MMRLNMDKQDDAEAEFEPAFKALVTTVLEGELVNVHCLAGVHRAATLMAVFRAALHDQSVDESIRAISGLRAVEIDKACQKYDKGGWRGGTFRAWLAKHAAIAKRIWQKALENRGLSKLGKTRDGNIIHLVRVREHQTSQDMTSPECQYKQKAASSKAMFGPGSTLTEATGREAAEEAVQWTFAAGQLQLCAGCAKHLSAGMLSVLENGGIA